MKQAINVLLAYLTCEEPVMQNKWLNLLSSFWHKDQGMLLKSITAQTGGYKVTMAKGDDTTIEQVISIPTLPNSQDIAFINGLQDALNTKVDKVSGKGLSTQDFTTTLKQKLEALENYIHPDFHQISEIEGLQEVLNDFLTASDLAPVSLTGDYNDLTNKPVFKAVQKEYADLAAMYADQVNQSSALLQFVQDARTAQEITDAVTAYSKYFEYLGTLNANETDYRMLSDSESAPISGNTVTKTSDIINDGATGVSPYVEQQELNGYVAKSEKGQALGTASLDENKKIYTDQIPDLAITKVVNATETTLSEFVAASANSTFEQGDVIVIENAGIALHYMYKGGEKTNVNEYSAINPTEIDWSRVVNVNANDLLEKIKAVDGENSGLDADLLRGVHWGNVNTDIKTSEKLISSGLIFTPQNNTVKGSVFRVQENGSAQSGDAYYSMFINGGVPNINGGFNTFIVDNRYVNLQAISMNNDKGLLYMEGNATSDHSLVTANVYKVWHSGNSFQMQGNNATFPGTVTATDFPLSSDERKKTALKEIRPEDFITTKIRKYYYKDNLDKLRYGVGARALEVTHPELVYTDNNGDKTVSYFDVLMLKAAQFDYEINQLRNENIQLNKRLEALEAKINS